ncbi:MAG: acetyltransferase [Saprospiraceae bacterium]
MGRGADVAYRYLSSDTHAEICGFTVDAAFLTQDSFRGRKVVPFEQVESIYPPDEYMLFIPMGFQQMNKLREQKYLASKEKGYKCFSYISSKVVSHDQIKCGENCFILENNTINFDVEIGNNVVIWSACQIGDLAVIEDHVWISSHAVLAGEVTVGRNSFLGVNATISNDVKIGQGSYIGANALITKDTETNSVHVVEHTRKLPIDSNTFYKMMHK